MSADVSLEHILEQCENYVSRIEAADTAHDLAHVKRVVSNVYWLTECESANAWITLPAAWLHDCVAVAKDSPLRSQSSRLAADAAVEFLRSIGYPESMQEQLHHAITAHSYSAGIPVATVEAGVVQDGDRLDSLGAIGIARCLLVGGRLNRPLCDAIDPFCDHRVPDDSKFTIDHFYCKLLKLPATMRTKAGRAEAQRRSDLMAIYLDQLRSEIVTGHTRSLVD